MRAALEAAWLKLKPTLDEATYERWRYQRDATAWKRSLGLGTKKHVAATSGWLET